MRNLTFIMNDVNLDGLSEELRTATNGVVTGLSCARDGQKSLVTVHIEDESEDHDAVITALIKAHDPKVLTERQQAAQAKAQQRERVLTTALTDKSDLKDIVEAIELLKEELLRRG
jgi:hypothetical protein